MKSLNGILLGACALFISVSLMQNTAFADESASNVSAEGATAPSQASVQASKSSKSITEGTYTISPKSTSKRMKVKSSSTKAGANVVMGKKSSSQTQKWYVKRAATAHGYRIQSVQSGRFLSATDDGKVVEAKYAGKADQVWIASYKSKSWVLTNKKTGMVLTASGNSLKTDDAKDSSAQKFVFTKANLLAAGTYYISPKSSKRVLGVSGNVTKLGANVKLMGRTSSANRKWTAVINSDGTYTFRNANSARVLSVKGTRAVKGANVYQGSLSSAKVKKWKLALNNNGGINIVSAANKSSYLGTGSLASGSNSKILKSSGAKTAVFKFTKTSKSSIRTKMERKVKKISSKTGWLLVANTKSCFVGVYKGKKGNWTPYAYFPCTPGAYSSPSKKGIYKVGLKGYSFGTSSYTCYYYTQYSGNYLFHSTLYNHGTFVHQDARMGIHASHGCIRLEIANAKWINKNIPVGTTVYVY